MKFVRNWDEMNVKLHDEAASNGGGSGSADKRFYRPKFNKDGTFNALIRFLPAPGNEIPLVKKFKHSFGGKSGRLDEECPTTIGGQCPVCEKNKEAWDSGDQKTARIRSRAASGISNILVITDPQCPENNGKQFLYRYCKTLIEKVMGAIKPSDSERTLGTKPINVFDYYNGANFRIKGIKTISADGFKKTDYSGSKFDDPSQLGDDQLIENIDKQLVSLTEFTDPSKFKTYQELETILNRVLGGSQPQPLAVVHTPVKTESVKMVSVLDPTRQTPTNIQPPVNIEDKKLDINAVPEKSDENFWDELEQ
jgi:hypothetical protein